MVTDTGPDWKCSTRGVEASPDLEGVAGRHPAAATKIEAAISRPFARTAMTGMAAPVRGWLTAPARGQA